jgi:hypothetical protein
LERSKERNKIAVVNSTTTKDTIATVGKTNPAFAVPRLLLVVKIVLNSQIICFFILDKSWLLSFFK